MTDSKKNGKIFSATEVGTLVESLRGDIRAVAEGVTYLHSDMDDVKTRLSSLEVEARSVKDVLRIAVPSINTRLNRLEVRTGT